MENLLFRMINNSYATEIVSVEMEFKPRLDSNVSSFKFAAPFPASALELYLCLLSLQHTALYQPDCSLCLF